MVNQRMSRRDLPAGECLCSYCTAKCCRYFALPIDEPTTLKDFDDLRWFMFHGRVSVFVDDGTWYLMIFADCEHLLEDNRCGIYETRPQICRDYSTENCEYDDDQCYDKFFETSDQIWEYAEAILPMTEPEPSDTLRLPVLSSVPV